MSIREGGPPRRQPPPYDPDAFDEVRYPVRPRRRHRSGQERTATYLGGGRLRVPDAIRFLIVAGIMAVVVVIAGLTVLRPLVRVAVVGWAWDNPGSLKVDFVAQFVREDLGDALDEPAGANPAGVPFDVLLGDTPQVLATRLLDAGLIGSERAFLYYAIRGNLLSQLQAGPYLLRETMTPEEVVTALVESKIVVTTVTVTFREQLRLEQLTAKLQTVNSGVDPQAFYDLAAHPPADLLAEFPWLVLPEGASLEGFLYPATYELVTSSNGGPRTVTTARDLIRMMLTAFADTVGPERMAVPEARGMDLYQVVTFASIVEREAVLDVERPLIAGVYQNRLDGYRKVARILNADPTVIYAVDTMALRAIPFSDWVQYSFWYVPDGAMSTIKVPEDLQGYQTYQTGGLIPGPICSPSLASIDAALAPDTAAGYLYFLAIPDGGGAHAFAKSAAEHKANLQKYGYR